MPDPVFVSDVAVVAPVKTVAEIVNEFELRVRGLEQFEFEITRGEIELLLEEIDGAMRARPDAAEALTELAQRLQEVMGRRLDVQAEQRGARRQKALLVAKLEQYERLLLAYESMPMTEILPADLRGAIDSLVALGQETPDAQTRFNQIVLVKKYRKFLERVEESRGLVFPVGALGQPPSSGPSFAPTDDPFGIVGAPGWETPVTGQLEPPEVVPWTAGTGTPCIVLYAGNPAAIAACEAARTQGLKICDPFSVGEAAGDCVSFGEIASPDNIAQSIQAQAEAAMAADAAGVPAEAMVSDPTRAPQAAWSITADPELLASDDTYRRIFDSYGFPAGEGWKRLTQYYNDLEQRLDDEEQRVAAGADPLTPAAVQLIGDLQDAAMAALSSGLIPYAVQQEAELEARAVVRRVYSAIASIGNAPATSEARIVLADAISDCIAGIDCGKVPQEFLAVTANEKNALDAIVGGQAFRSAIGGGALEDVISYWDKQGRHFSQSERDDIREQLLQQLTLAVRDESRRPVSLPDYSAYAPESLNRDEARLLVEAMRANVNGQVDAFIESGQLCVEAGPFSPVGPDGVSEVAVGLEQLSAKYYPTYELFGSRGFLPLSFHTVALRLKANAARGAALQEVGELSGYIEGVTGITPGELAKEVTARIAVINRDICEMLFRAAEGCITIQAVWDNFFAYCNEIQAINQVVYLGMFKAMQMAFGGAVRAAFARTPAAGQQLTEFWMKRATSKMADDIRYQNYQEYKTHLAMQQAAASSITRYQRGVGPWAGKDYVGPGAFPNGMAQSTVDAQGNFVHSFVPELNQWLYRQVNPYTGAQITSMAEWEAVALRSYREGRLAVGLNPDLLWPVGRVGILPTPEDASISQALFGVAPAATPVRPALLGPGGVAGFMVGFGPAGALLGLGAMTVDSATQALMDRVNPKMEQIPAKYVAEFQVLNNRLLAQAKAQIGAGQEVAVDFIAELDAFFQEKGEPEVAELVRAEMEALSSDPNWGETLGGQETDTATSLAERLGALSGRAAAICGNPEAYEPASTQLYMVLGEIKLLETDPSVNPQVLALIRGEYTWIEQNAQALLAIEQGTLGSQ
jgi:hypothetical protein